MTRCCPTSLHREAAMNFLETRGQTSKKTQNLFLKHNFLLTSWFGQKPGLSLHTTVLFRLISGLSVCAFFSCKPRGVRSKRIRQKERLVRYETPPSAAGGGTPGENMRTKAEDENRDSG